MHLAHSHVLWVHLGVKNTIKKINNSFHMPGLDPTARWRCSTKHLRLLLCQVIKEGAFYWEQLFPYILFVI